jgi:hypothetical protein
MACLFGIHKTVALVADTKALSEMRWYSNSAKRFDSPAAKGSKRFRIST